MNKHFLFAGLLIFISLPTYAEIDAKDCENSIKNAQSHLTCTIRIYLNATEQNKMWLDSHETIQNLFCNVRVNVNKADLLTTLSRPTARFSKIPFSCDILFNDQTKKIAIFDINPELILEGNKIISASLNPSDITGIGFLGLLIKKFFNTNTFKEQTKDAINKALEKLLK